MQRSLTQLRSFKLSWLKPGIHRGACNFPPSDLSDMRKSYRSADDTLSVDQFVSTDPFQQFNSWFKEAAKCPKIYEANTMCLSTCSLNGKPSSRILLLKGIDHRGFLFYTNYESRKAQELEENPKASLCFYWDALMRSVRVDGEVEKLDKNTSEKYFQSRPKDSQISVYVSEKQSLPVESRQLLELRRNELNKRFEKIDTLPKPDYWGGYRLVPKEFEFWQGQTDRLHDRFVFRLSKVGWKIQRLFP
ncbi:DgyrCDS1934 [Dimorphilus gyrociliatus]|uniref:pyridoxal 5'-phosphate synthase n=1 Tax=Dimorphilus gyrociliatus TaxID=2664684 RepID=A0A7I8VDV3_9ANNE|nr:DgyrCDS1934 [Dimorphilus gyrociliatus]